MYILNAPQVVSYLLGKGVLPASAVVDGDVMVVETPRRNRNFRVLNAGGQGLFVKQAKFEDPATGPYMCRSIRIESATYDLLCKNAPLSALATGKRLFDPKFHVLVTTLIDDAEDLGQYYRRIGQFPAEMAAAVAVALARVHREGVGPAMAAARANSASGPAPSAARAQDPAATPTPFAGTMPWMLWFADNPAQTWNSVSQASGRLQGVIRDFPAFAIHLEAIRAQWQINAMIHGDIRLENLLVNKTTGAAGGVRLIDWELADLGDACWDVGGFLQCFLAAWIYSVPNYSVAAQAMYDSATIPLENLRPAIWSFWNQYAGAMGLDVSERQVWLGRAIAYASVRLVQSAYEILLNAVDVSPTALCLIQVAMNMMDRPRQAAEHLLGFAA